MTQFWRVERLRYDAASMEAFATVSGLTGSHRLRISGFSFSPRSLTLHFYPSAGELVFRDGSVFLGGVQLERVNGYQVDAPVDAIVTARLDIAIANIEQEILPAEYFQGIPIRAETHCFDFLVSEATCSDALIAIEPINAGEFLEITGGRFVRRSQGNAVAQAGEAIPIGAFVEISGTNLARVAQGVPSRLSRLSRLQFDDRYGWVVASTDELNHEAVNYFHGRMGIDHSRSPKICQNCRNYHGRSYNGNSLVCGIHPYGNGEDCSDFEGVMANGENINA
jgi:hypothetical protein